MGLGSPWGDFKNKMKKINMNEKAAQAPLGR